jgi:hypothetical protein
MKTLNRRLVAALLAVAGAGLVAGCSLTNVAVQWSDPKFAGHSLNGEKVLIVCEAPDVAIRKTCQDDVAAQIQKVGATPVIRPDPGLTLGPPPAGAATLAAARAAGAKAIFGSTLAQDATVVSSGGSFGFGMGGVGGGGGRAGVGFGFPMGGTQTSSSLKASVVLTDVASASVMWTSTITTQASDDIRDQIHELTRVGVEAARDAGFFKGK